MDLRQLKYFLVAADTGSLTHASARIPIAQSALSRHIRLLEEELGTQLLIRTGRGVKLTSQGEYLAERARSILDQLEDTRRCLTALDDTPSGLVRIGMPPSFTVLLASNTLQTLKERFPNINARLSEGLSADLSEWLSSDRLDLAIVFDAPPKMAVKSVKIGTEELCLAITPGTKANDPISIKEMSRHRLIVPFSKRGFRARMANAFDKAGIELPISYELNALPAMKDLVKAGAGSAIITRSSIATEIEQGVIEARTIDAEGMNFDVFLTLSRAAEHSRAAQETVEIIQEIVSKFFK